MRQRNPKDNEPVWAVVITLAQTAKARLVKNAFYPYAQGWLPNSLHMIEGEEPGYYQLVSMPRWLAVERGLDHGEEATDVRSQEWLEAYACP